MSAFRLGHSRKLVCLQCGQAIDGKAEFCPYCGADLAEAKLIQEGKESICPQCEKKVEGTPDFCPYCGAKMEEDEAAPDPVAATDGDAVTTPDKPRRKLPLKVIIPIAAVLVVGIAAFAVWRIFFYSSLPAACHYSLARMESYDEDGNLVGTTEYTLNEGGAVTEGARTSYDDDGDVDERETYYYDVDEEYGISIMVDDEGDNAHIEVTDEDEFGQPTSFTWKEGEDDRYEVEYEYYDEGRIASIGEVNYYALTYSSYEITRRYEYDEDGWCTGYSRVFTDNDDYHSGSETEYDYERDEDGRVVSVTKTSVDDEGDRDVYVYEYEYNEDGLVASYTNDDGWTYNYTYEYVRHPAPMVAAQNYLRN